MRATAGVLAGAVLAGFAAGVAGAQPSADPGVTPTSILIGGTAPADADAFQVGANAYLRWVNAHGQVNGRGIRYRRLDDGGDPDRTLASVRRLVEHDGVFAIFAVPGSESNLVIRAYLNARGVPQLLSDSGATELASSRYTIGFRPTSTAEGTVYGRYLATVQPQAKVAVLYAGVDGEQLLAGLRSGFGRPVVAVPAQEPLDSQVAALRASGAGVLALFGLGSGAARAVTAAVRLGWRPQILVDAATRPFRAAGAISSTWTKDPADRGWAKDPGILLARRALPTPDADDLAGMASAFTLVDVLRRAGQDPTRESVLKAAGRLTEANNPFLLPGIVVKTGPGDRFPIQQLQLERWSGARWARFGGLVSAG